MTNPNRKRLVELLAKGLITEDEFERLAGSGPPSPTAQNASTPPPPPLPTESKPRRRWSYLVAALVMAITLGSAAIFFVVTQNTEEPSFAEMGSDPSEVDGDEESNLRTLSVTVFDDTEVNRIPGDFALSFSGFDSKPWFRLFPGANSIEVDPEDIVASINGQGELLVAFRTDGRKVIKRAFLRDLSGTDLTVEINDFGIEVTSDWFADFWVDRHNQFLRDDCAATRDFFRQWRAHIDALNALSWNDNNSASNIRRVSLERVSVVDELLPDLRFFQRSVTYVHEADDLRAVVEEYGDLHLALAAAQQGEVNALIVDINAVIREQQDIVDSLYDFFEDFC